MAKWKNKLVVSDLKHFSKMLYDNENNIYDYKMANDILKELNNNLKEIYSFLEDLDNIIEDTNERDKIELYNNIDIYLLGDTINLLDNIVITKNIL